MNRKKMTLARHVLEQQKYSPKATGELSSLLIQLGLAAKTIVREVSRAGLVNILGLTGETNVQGEAVKKLDRFANEVFVEAFGYGGLLCTLISEEMEKPLHLPENCPQGHYTLLVDPIDGSSNIDVNGIFGSIFSFQKRPEGEAHGTPEALLRKGSEQIAAGYIMYGPSTMLVYTVGSGVHGFTLDPGVGEFFLSHENIRIPTRSRAYSVNQGNYRRWAPEVQRLVDDFSGRGDEGERGYALRYAGSLLADIHRILLEGGIYLYPGSLDQPEGKLRLLYEAAPLALVVEQAGGRASTGTESILALQPKNLHQRVPLFIGSPEEVARAESFIRSRRRKGINDSGGERLP
ncbi:class 1 fructose-bisphosphatase [Candidatus Manganitrophus noduliformans]|uniref:Fructose-1,6-bisphosphatase class 1 n=1 Tax=Candidatus Manganitrophus noduliformans TaxID=2606439 RepID=A0A7X6IA96_9BACT|nr:class 1 fructose-bisphosphatase [Candidatus Manganitrophus noduliformans]NKE70266.1 class 1 fructose-bisphosphatase [Candidatus Manganitrophus noduliformans]